MNREQIKQTLIDHGVSDIPGALLDALAQSPRSCCADERERCAKIAENFDDTDPDCVSDRIATAIRSNSHDQ